MNGASSPSGFAASVLASLRRYRLKPGTRLGLAVSGGADSVALLRVLLELRGELGIVLSVLHFNHTLRGDESEADHAFVNSLASQNSLPFQDFRGDVARRAHENSLSIETAAREARYEFFWSLIEAGHLDKVATAHTLDDQAETVLMRLIRGTGTRGLGGIHPELAGPSGHKSGQTSRGSIIRPFLHIRRREIESYLAGLSQPWREDSSNQDLYPTRNRVRKLLIPLLEREFNEEIREHLADFADIAQAEEDYLDRESRRCLGTKPLQMNELQALPLALRRRVVRLAAPEGLALEFAHVEAILEVVAEATRSANLPSGWAFRREGGLARFVPPEAHSGAARGLPEAITGTLRLPVPGEVCDPGTGRRFRASRILLAEAPAGYNPEHLYAPQALPSELVVRTWRFGDRYWPAHTKAPKKLKELFQVKKIAGELRATWPVMVAEGAAAEEEVVWMQGFAAPARLRPGADDREAIWLQELVG